jgi:hypothetical protein
MFSWCTEEVDKIREIAKKNKAIADFTVEDIYTRGIQGECLVYRGKKFTSIPDLKRKFPDLIFCNIGTFGNIEVPDAKCDDGIIINPKNSEEDCFILFYDWPQGGGICLCRNILDPRSIRVQILENDPEVFIYKQKHKIAYLEHSIKSAEEFLSNPWKEYERKKLDFEQKLGKSKSVTEFKIAHTTEQLKMYKKYLEEANEELVNYIKGGWIDDKQQ